MESVEKLRVNALGQAEVDDFLWIMMIQWAKLSAWYIARSSQLSSTIEKNHIDKKLKSSDDKGNLEMIQAVKNGSYTKQQILERKSSMRTLPVLPAANLRSIIESIYRPGEGKLISDPQHFVSSYLQRVASSGRSNLKVFARSVVDSIETTDFLAADRSKFSLEMEKVLQDCVLWDVNSLGNSFKGRLDFMNTGNIMKSSVSSSNDESSNSDNVVVKEMSDILNVALITNPLGNVVVLLPFNPELSYAMVRSSFQTIEKPIRNILEMVNHAYIFYDHNLYCLL